MVKLLFRIFLSFQKLWKRYKRSFVVLLYRSFVRFFFLSIKDLLFVSTFRKEEKEVRIDEEQRKSDLMPATFEKRGQKTKIEFNRLSQSVSRMKVYTRLKKFTLIIVVSTCTTIQKIIGSVTHS
jgi:hypothetical protein